MLNDEERAALKVLQRQRAEVGGEEPHIFESGFAAGIKFAQTWRSMESAPGLTNVLVRAAGGVYVARWRHPEQEWVINGSGGSIVFEPTGWLPLPPTEIRARKDSTT